MNNTKIELCRIDRNGKDAILNIIYNYAGKASAYGFTVLQITGYFFDKGTEHKQTIEYDISEEIEGIDGNYIVSINLSQDFGHSTHGFYYLEFFLDEEKVESGCTVLESSVSPAYVSDVEFMYHCMSSELLSIGDDVCDPMPDSVLQKFMLLQGHLMAMQLHEYSDAKFLYRKMLQLCGYGCNPVTNCGCGGTVRPIIKPITSCGCKL